MSGLGGLVGACVGGLVGAWCNLELSFPEGLCHCVDAESALVLARVYVSVCMCERAHVSVYVCVSVHTCQCMYV